MNTETVYTSLKNKKCAGQIAAGRLCTCQVSEKTELSLQRLVCHRVCINTDF